MAAAAFIALAACNNEYGINTDVDAGSINIEATIGRMTKVSYSGNASSFTAGDKLLLYGWTGSKEAIPATRVVDSVTNTFDGTVWTPVKQMNWKNATDAHYFLGISPVPDSVTSFTAAAYKLDPANYTASDLLIATNLSGVKATGGSVVLTFDHAMAKLTVNLKFRNEFAATPAVSSVTATAYDSATVNYLTKEVTVAGTVAAVNIPASTASVPQGYALSFSGLQVPQEGVRIVTVIIGGKEYVYEAAADIPLVSGQYTTLDLVLGKDKIELSSVSVADWTAGADLTGGEAMLQNAHNGHEYVDLGLPSGLKWATCNVGASAPEEYGDYFAWGDTVPCYSSQDPLTWRENKTKGYSWASYTWCNGSLTTLTKYCSKSEFGKDGYTDARTTLDPEDDAAGYQWGGSWRMPAKADIDELIATKDNATDYTWTWCDGSTTKYAGTDVAGWRIVRNSTGATLFLPTAGCRLDTSLYYVGSYGGYWSSSLHTGSPSGAWYIYFYSGSVYADYDFRYLGLSVRPVCP